MKLLKILGDNILFVITLFLLAFIPLYPKLPIVDVKNTWVYVRAEDFMIVFVLLLWVFLIIRKKITLKTPLTLPIMIFWIIGGIATIHAVLLIFPTLANVFPNVAFLSYLRRIEYVSLFFIGYAAMRDKRLFPYVILVLAVTLLCVAGYGFGQKYLEFCAYLTMNEEFAKGSCIHLSGLSRVPSTFAGHYDLAAYLVLIIPILASLIFGFKNWFIKLFLLATVGFGFILLLMTVSRVSVFVLLVVLGGLLFFQKKRLIIFSIPVIVILVLLSLSFSTSLFDRFGNTIKEVDVLVDAKTGEAIGHVRESSSKDFENRTIRRKYVRGRDEIASSVASKREDQTIATSSAIVPFLQIPPQVTVLVPPNTPTGENLPQGTGYINLLLSPVIMRKGEIFYDKSSSNLQAPGSNDVIVFDGDFLIKRASAYDLSFTTRFQGEWPRALAAFKKNVLFGSGFSSVSLAVDNNYLRILGETGLLGFISFFAIFIIGGIYIVKVLPQVDSPVIKSFVLGFVAGVAGLALNATLIDVFEASKVAFILWLLSGITLGILSFYPSKQINLYKEFKNVITSNFAIVLYLLIASIFLFSPMINNYFVGDDFTWFRWIADCNSASGSCSPAGKVLSYFTNSDGFFYRPGTKVYFLLMYSVFWLNQAVYHMVSLFLHFAVASLLFFVAKKILKDYRLSALASFLFLIVSGYSEAVFWISSTGFLFNAVFVLLSLLFFILWNEKKRSIYLVLSSFSIVLSLLFHELGIVAPLLILLYKFVIGRESPFGQTLKKVHYYILFFPIILYLFIRFISHSHWFNGDYSYNLLKLPFNALGNAIGYVLLDVFGSASLPLYKALRDFSKDNIFISIIFFLVMFGVFIFSLRFVSKKINKEDKKIVIFGSLFFVISLLPFLGLGNITSRYSYLASVGFMLIFVFFAKKIYIYLKSNGRDIAIASVVGIITLFSLLHIIQIQQIHSDWYEAGQKAKKFLVSIDRSYVKSWANEPVELYFVDLPIRHGEAWIFPVGLSDALWFSFQNDKLSGNASSSLIEAADFAGSSKRAHIFQFQPNGSVEEMIRLKNNTIVPKNL